MAEVTRVTQAGVVAIGAADSDLRVTQAGVVVVAKDATAAAVRVTQAGVVVVSFLDISQELGANDAATSPHQRNFAIIQIPVVFLGSRPHQLITLRI